MTSWPFVIAAYALAGGGTLSLVLPSLLAMRRAEAAAADKSRP